MDHLSEVHEQSEILQSITKRLLARSESITAMMELSERLNEIVAEMEIRRKQYLETLRA